MTTEFIDVVIPRKLTLGYKYARIDGVKTIAIHQYHAETVRLAFRLAAQGKLGTRKISAAIHAELLQGKASREIAPTTLWRLLKDRRYIGSEDYPAILSESLFDHVQAVIYGKKGGR